MRTDIPTNKVIQQYEAGATVAQIASKYASSVSPISRILYQAGVRMRSSGVDQDEVIRLCEGMRTYQQVGDELGVSQERVRQILISKSRRDLVGLLPRNVAPFFRATDRER